MGLYLCGNFMAEEQKKHSIPKGELVGESGKDAVGNRG